MLDNIRIFQHISKKFWDCKKTAHYPNDELWLFVFDFNMLINRKMFFYSNGKFLFLSFFGRVGPKIENMKSRDSWCSTWVQHLKNASQWYATCKRFSLMENKNIMVINKHRIFDGQQFKYYFVFNRFIKSKLTKNISNYFEKFVM